MGVESVVSIDDDDGGEALARDFGIDQCVVGSEDGRQSPVEPVDAFAVVLEPDHGAGRKQVAEVRRCLRPEALHRLVRVLRLGSVDVEQADWLGSATKFHFDGVAVDDARNDGGVSRWFGRQHDDGGGANPADREQPE